jgi:hypothetical protein
VVGMQAGCPSNQVCVMGPSGPQCGQCNTHTDCPLSTPLCHPSTHTCLPCTGQFPGMTGGDNGCSMRTMPAQTICTVTGTCAKCDPSSHRQCNGGELCCAGSTGELSCVPTSAQQCTACGVACSGICTPGTRSCLTLDAGIPPLSSGL